MEHIKVTGKKKTGAGTISLIISIIAVMFSFTYVNGNNLGDYFLDFINVSFPSAIISLVLFLTSVFLGVRYREHFGAKIGRNISIVFIILITISTTISTFVGR